MTKKGGNLIYTCRINVIYSCCFYSCWNSLDNSDFQTLFETNRRISFLFV